MTATITTSNIKSNNQLLKQVQLSTSSIIQSQTMIRSMKMIMASTMTTNTLLKNTTKIWNSIHMDSITTRMNQTTVTMITKV